MIVGKDSAKVGFSWYGRTCTKLLGAGILAAHGGFMLFIGILLFGVGVYEGITEWKEINNTKHTKR